MLLKPPNKIIQCNSKDGCNFVDNGATELKNTYFLNNHSNFIQCTTKKCEIVPDELIEYKILFKWSRSK